VLGKSFELNGGSKNGGFHSHGGTPIAGWLRENPIKMDLGVDPRFRKPPNREWFVCWER
jgi:hypothetical protein